MNATCQIKKENAIGSGNCALSRNMKCNGTMVVSGNTSSRNVNSAKNPSQILNTIQSNSFMVEGNQKLTQINENASRKNSIISTNSSKA
mmetsp:Transcript_14826/g.14410  ORF Transcript_14826/g.14410 Transcript_14826/m.14410 type:complete len:89 (-) Transcript_14826:597-863(-)